MKRLLSPVLGILLGIMLWITVWLFIAFFVEGWLVSAALGNHQFPKLLPKILIASHILPILIAGWFGYLKSDGSWRITSLYSLISLLVLVLAILYLVSIGFLRIDQYHFLILLG